MITVGTALFGCPNFDHGPVQPYASALFLFHHIQGCTTNHIGIHNDDKLLDLSHKMLPQIMEVKAISTFYKGD